MEQTTLSNFRNSLVESYDQLFRNANYYFGDRREKGFANLGLFQPETSDHETACENLMERLLGLIRQQKNIVLDVGCGLGGSTQSIARHFPPEKIHGINISEYQLSECRVRIPQANFYLMAAESLAFRKNMFDTVVSVEAAPHFQGRYDFIKEAYRVLKPGGELVVADMLFTAQPKKFRKALANQEIYKNLEEYRALYEKSGFCDISFDDVTNACWKGFTEYTKSRALKNLITKKIDGDIFQQLLKFAKKFEELPVLAYVLVHCCKPM
ncbi:MAG: class I SAM-dependent methyltransferase [Candidatus Riflebacteria bacterium]|nr:class I SAM-dependent methyltransferase [Candidatus Riflebacteria bacterium]